MLSISLRCPLQHGPQPQPQPQLLDPLFFFALLFDVALRDWLLDCWFVVVDELLSLYKSLAPIKKKTGKATKKKKKRDASFHHRPEGPELLQAESHLQRPRVKRGVKLSGGDGWGPWLCLSSTTTQVTYVLYPPRAMDPFMIKYINVKH